MSGNARRSLPSSSPTIFAGSLIALLLPTRLVVRSCKGGHMRILILGGDGYLGWPQALYLSRKGHAVTIFDNFMRRRFDLEYGLNSLLPIEPLQRRVGAWKEVSGFHIDIKGGDTT